MDWYHKEENEEAEGDTYGGLMWAFYYLLKSMVWLNWMHAQDVHLVCAWPCSFRAMLKGSLFYAGT
jgi:hypothetical protein